MKKILSSIFLAVGLFGLSHNVEAAVPWIKHSYFSNYGGLNDNLSQLEIKDNEATDIQNVLFDNGGALVKRYGFSNITGTAGPAFKLGSNVTGVVGLAYYQKTDGSKYLFAIGNNATQATGYSKTIDASGGVPSGAWTSQGAGNLPSNLTNNQLATFSVAENTLVMTVAGSSSSTTYPSAWEATGNVYQFTSDTDCPKAKYNAYHKNIFGNHK